MEQDRRPCPFLRCTAGCLPLRNLSVLFFPFRELTPICSYVVSLDSGFCTRLAYDFFRFLRRLLDD